MRRKPLSSRNSRWAPSPCAFFYMRPLVTLPMSNGLFVPLDRLTLGYLASPPCAPQQSPDVIGVVYNTEFLSDYGPDSFQRPQIVWKTVCRCPFQKKLQQLPAFVLAQFARTTRNRFGLQSIQALLNCRLLPPEDRGERCADTLCNLLQSQTALDQCDGPLSATFQCLRGSDGSHAS